MRKNKQEVERRLLYDNTAGHICQHDDLTQYRNDYRNNPLFARHRFTCSRKDAMEIHSWLQANKGINSFVRFGFAPVKEGGRKLPAKPKKEKAEGDIATEDEDRKLPAKPKKEKAEGDIATEEEDRKLPAKPEKEKAEGDIATEDEGQKLPAKPKKAEGITTGLQKMSIGGKGKASIQPPRQKTIEVSASSKYLRLLLHLN